MNTKTTLTLAFILVLLVLAYYFVQSRPGLAESTAPPPPPVGAATAERDVLPEKLGDVVKVVCRRKGAEEWVFEKQAKAAGDGQAVWRMTSPLEFECVRWEVEKFGNQLGSLKYEISYKPGEPGAVSAEQAGLDPPEAVVTLTDADDKSVTMQIGKPASSRETYVSLAGSDVIYLGKNDLRHLIKEEPFEYRDKQLWDFASQDVTRVEVVDRAEPQAPVTYVLRRDGDHWMMEAPVTARAANKKIDDMLGTMGRIRAVAWQDDRQEMLPVYGLDPAALIVRATVEKEVPIEAKDANEQTSEPEMSPERPDEEEHKTETKVTVYELQFSNQSPIGEDTKTYMRADDESLVATVMKSTVDKFKPKMAEWRDMDVTPVATANATRIELSTGEGSATFIKEGDNWTFESDGAKAEGAAVEELLKAVDNLVAVAFVDEQAPDLHAYGLDAPRAAVRLTIPGVEGVESISVGDYTDAATKRLVYVRRNEFNSIAKVRAEDVAAIIRPLDVYKDRTVLDVPADRIERIALSTPVAGESGKGQVAFERSDDTWTMVEPVSSPARGEALGKLAQSLADLRAQQVVATAAEASAYGLDDPSATVTLTYQPPTEYRIETSESAESPSAEGKSETPSQGPETGAPIEEQPAPQTVELWLAEHEGNCFVRRADGDLIYRVDRSLYDQLTAEYHTDRIFDFDETRVYRLIIRNGDQTHSFEKREGTWVYEPEPDLPLDPKKLQNLVSQLKDLRTKRYVRYHAEDLSPYGLSAPRHEVRVVLDDGRSQALWVSGKRGVVASDRGFYAALKGQTAVFLLPESEIKRLEVSLGDLEAPVSPRSSSASS